MERKTRPGWDDYFMEIAKVVSSRSTCMRRSVGAVIVKNKQIVATGYNGTPKDLPHCEVTGCLREQLHVPSGQMHELCRGIHAEQNAVVQAAYHGVSVNGGTIYCTHQPCVVCTKILINAGIKRIVYANPYPDKLAEDMMADRELKSACWIRSKYAVKKHCSHFLTGEAEQCFAFYAYYFTLT